MIFEHLWLQFWPQDLLFVFIHFNCHVVHWLQDVHKRFRTESHSEAAGRFNERFLLSIASCKACLVMDDEMNILPISSHIRSITPVLVNEVPSFISCFFFLWGFQMIFTWHFFQSYKIVAFQTLPKTNVLSTNNVSTLMFWDNAKNMSFPSR